MSAKINESANMQLHRYYFIEPLLLCNYCAVAVRCWLLAQWKISNLIFKLFSIEKYLLCREINKRKTNTDMSVFGSISSGFSFFFFVLVIFLFSPVSFTNNKLQSDIVLAMLKHQHQHRSFFRVRESN